MSINPNNAFMARSRGLFDWATGVSFGLASCEAGPSHFKLGQPLRKPRAASAPALAGLPECRLGTTNHARFTGSGDGRVQELTRQQR